MEKHILTTYGVYAFNRYPDTKSVVIGVETLRSGSLMVDLLQFSATGIFEGYSCQLQATLVNDGFTELGEVFNNTNGWTLTLENYHDHN